MNAPFLFMAIWYGGFKGYFFESSYLARVPVEKLSGEKLKQALLKKRTNFFRLNHLYRLHKGSFVLV